MTSVHANAGHASSPRVSAIVPAFNYAQYIADAIDSILSQDLPGLEVVVVDDASTGGTRAVVTAYGESVRYVRQPHRMGSGAAINRGVAISTGEFLTFLDADDMWPPDRLVRQLAEFDRDPSAELVFGHAEEFYSPELTDEERAQLAPRHVPVRLVGTMMTRRATCDRIGGFGEGLTFGEFMDWYARAIEAGLREVMLPDIALRRRLHATNLGRRDRRAHPDDIHVIKRSLDRRRAAGMVAPLPPRPSD